MNARPLFSNSILSLLLLVGLAQSAHAAPPPAPSGCFAVAYNPTATTATVSVNWNDNSTNEIQWKIQVSVNNGPFVDLGTIASGTTATTGSPIGIVWQAAPLNSILRFTVLALTSTEVSAPSNIATVGSYPLNSPINLNITAVDPFNVSLTWEEGSTSETGFALEMKVGTGPWVYLGTLDPNTVAFGPYHLVEPAGSYSFRIRVYQGGEPSTPGTGAGASAVSDYSNEAPVTTGDYLITATATPGQPTINLSWPNILNEAGYQLMIRRPGDPGFLQLDLLAANTTTYQVSSPILDPGRTYWFKVRPYDSGGNFMGSSNEFSATTDGITSKTGTSDVPGAVFSHSFTHASDAAVVSRSLTGVPGTLTFNATTGVLSGTYPALGNYVLNYTLNLSNGAVLTQSFHIRVRPPAGPPLVGTAIPPWTGIAGTTRDTPLAGTFTDPEADSAVRVSTTLGTMDFILFDAATPVTVANFMNYVNAGSYTDVAFHRSVPNFVIQSGGFKGTGTGADFTSVITTPPIVNEPGVANVRGTISMAKTAVSPDTATSQFFISVGDNRANLDYQNGGFTVFGRVAGNSITVADAINGLPNGTYPLFLDGSTTATDFDNFPMNDSVLPVEMDQSKLVKLNSVTPIPTLSYSVTGNTNPAVATAAIVGDQLHLVGLGGGQTTITVTATDLDGLTTNQNVNVNLSDTYASWAARAPFPDGQSGITQNPDSDSLTNLQEYALFGNPTVSSQAQAPLAGKTGTLPAPQFLTLTFPVRKFTTGLSYTVEAHHHLSGSWTEIWSSGAGFSHPQVVSAVDEADRTVVTIKDTAAISGQPHRFLRLKLSQN